jgi:hypothetical protein
VELGITLCAVLIGSVTRHPTILCPDMYRYTYTIKIILIYYHVRQMYCIDCHILLN